MLIQNTRGIAQRLLVFTSLCFAVDAEVGLALMRGHCDDLK